MSTKSKSKSPLLSILSFISFISILSILFITISLYYYFTRPQSPSSPSTTFTISKGESVASIANRLSSEGYIAHPLALKIYLKLNNLSSKVQAGQVTISKSQDLATLSTALTQAKAQSIRVTLLEGTRREEMALTLQKTFTDNGLQFNPQEFLSLTPNLEGQLFPDTYDFPLDATPADVVAKLTSTFATKITTPLDSQISSSTLTLNQLLTMASIVEREARSTAQPIVAGILLKRLREDWPLQADATLQYAKATGKGGDWWPDPLAADKDLTSPFNTYQNPGLPPRPICNPSLSAIQAVLNPTTSEYWYYISDLDGRMHYSVTYNEHLAAVEKYLK